MKTIAATVSAMSISPKRSPENIPMPLANGRDGMFFHLDRYLKILVLENFGGITYMKIVSERP